MRFLGAVITLTAISLLLVACAANPDKGETSPATKTAKKAAQSPPAGSTSGTPLLARPGTNSGLGQPQSAAGGSAASGGGSDEGSHLFTEMGCVACHGATGKGVIKNAPDFTNKAWSTAQTDDQMAATIKGGHPPMPPYGGRLTDGQIKSLVAYVRSFVR